DAVANRCTVRFGTGPLVKRRLENFFGGDVLRINHRDCGRANTRSSVYYGKNAILVVEISLHQGSDLPQVAQVFCRFCALKSTSKGWNEDRGEYENDRDYNQHLDQGEGALNRGRGTFGHDSMIRSARYCPWTRSESE